MTNALGIRSEVNPLGPEVENLVTEALAALGKMEAEAVAGGDPMASYFAMQGKRGFRCTWWRELTAAG